MKFSNITYCTGVVTSLRTQARCMTCARYRTVMIVDSEVLALWFIDKPALAVDCEMFRPKKQI